MIDVVSARSETPPAIAAAPELFTLGRAAVSAARQLTGGRGLFSRSRQLLGTGGWRGPRDAAESFIEDGDLAAAGGLESAIAAGARALVTADVEMAHAAVAAGLRVLCKVPFAPGEADQDRLARMLLVAGVKGIDGVLPAPLGEPLGLDTLRVIALCRLHAGVPHVVADFARLGHRLAQMALGFGADELWGPIVSERALRLGDNANNPALTRKEAATLIRGAGLDPFERVSGGRLEAFVA